MFVPDPFIYLRYDGQPHIVMNDEDLNRARAGAKHCRVHSLSALLQRLRRAGRKNPRIKDVIALILREQKIRKVAVPQTFPHGIAQDLKRNGFKVKPRKGTLFPARELKSAEEVKKISAALTMAEVGLAEGIHALRNSKVSRKGEILFRGSRLTSERLRAIIDTAMIQAGGSAGHTIVAGGRHSCEPHECGHGPLPAHLPIILNVLPRSQKTGYFGKITRTVVKGKATEAVRAIYQAVTTAQDLVFSLATDGVSACDLHKTVSEYFEKHGYRTRRQGGKLQGFLHSTGHGLGLESHELPDLCDGSDAKLMAGHVLSIQPGLYYTETGGIRLEDIAHVTKSRARNLTQFEKILEV
jgi:Xaa-Pro aminopeptidase